MSDNSDKLEIMQCKSHWIQANLCRAKANVTMTTNYLSENIIYARGYNWLQRWLTVPPQVRVMVMLSGSARSVSRRRQLTLGTWA